MQIVDIKNFDVLDILQDFRYTFMIKYDVTKTNTFINDDRNSDYWCGDEFLNSIKINHDGSPDAARSYCLKPDHYEGDEKTDYCLDYMSLDSRLKTELGVQHSALSQLYPPSGYIAWHTNENACAYNLIFTYSETGDGYFDYIDPKTGDKIRIQDKKGWNCKAGYFGSQFEKDRIVYHCASTNCWRMTLSFTLGHDYDFWRDCIDHINTD